jgi:DNA-binding HxlR family transcriptional regulator
VINGVQSHSDTNSLSAANKQQGGKVYQDRMQILQTLKAGPLCDEQIQAYCPEINTNALRARRGSLVNDGFIEGAGRTTTSSGNTATAWRLTFLGGVFSKSV